MWGERVREETVGSAVDGKTRVVVATTKPTCRPNGSHRRTSTVRTFLASRHQTVTWPRSDASGESV